MAERHVVLGLARSRTPWFGELARWAATAVAPIEFVKTLTSEEARAVLGAGRPVSIVLVDAELPRLDRTVVSTASELDVPTVLVGRHGSRDWQSLGCTARLDPDFERDELVELLDRIARRVPSEPGRTSRRVDLGTTPDPGRLIGVAGCGGSGSTTLAMALAQAFADDGRDTVLVDGCRRADLAMYHDVGDVIPGLPELVALHRGDDADPEEIRALEFDSGRGYRLILGLRRPGDWAGMRAASVTAAIDGLRRTHDVVVLDVDTDLDTEADTGSTDVEDRHAVALAVARHADVVVAVGTTDLRGTLGLTHLAHDLTRAGTDPTRIVSVVNRAPRSTLSRTRTARAIRSLDGSDTASVAFVRAHRGLDAIHGSVDRLPRSMGGPVLAAVTDAFDRPREQKPVTPRRVRIGELGATAGSVR